MSATLKYVHARMPGRELVHLVPAAGLEIDERFGSENHLVGDAKTLCGKRSRGWIIGAGGEPCRRCATKR